MTSGSWGVASNAYAAGSADAGLAPDREDLVRVVLDRPRLARKSFALVTPFAGKAFCSGDYLRGIRRLPLKQAHAVWYDNSRSPQFRRRLLAALERYFDSYTLIEDTNEPYTVERTDDYRRIDERVYRIYRRLLEDHLCDLPFTFVIEDDVEVPANAWPRLVRIVEEDPRIGTAVGSMNARRIVGDHSGAPVAWVIDRRQQIGGDWQAQVTMQRIMVEKPAGVELVGAAHTGCWLSRTSVIRKLGVRFRHDGVSFVDQTWGYRLNLAGYRMALDWGVKTRHYYLADGKKEHV